MDLVNDVETDVLADRYGSARPRRRVAVIVVSALVGLLGLAWIGWTAWSHSNPEVQSSLRTFDVVDTHSVTAGVAVRARSERVSASCLVRAFGADHSVVGELNFKVSGASGTTLRTVQVRTEREATSVELIGCTAEGQPRPR